MRSAFRRSLALAVLSGVLYGAALPPFEIWPLAFVSFAPLFVALHGRSPRQALLLGAVQGSVATVACGTWLPAVIRTFGEAPWSVCWAITVVIYLHAGGRAAAMAWLAVRAERRGWPRGLALVLAFVASEALYPLLLPLFTAVQVHRVPLLMQLAELGGPILVGVPLVMTSVALAEVGWARLDARPLDRRRLALALLGPAAMLVFGAARTRQIDARIARAPRGTIAIVQGNLPHSGSTLAEAEATYREATTRLLAKNAKNAKSEVDLVVWPETALTGVVGRDFIEWTLRDLTGPGPGQAELTTPILTGAFLQDGTVLTNSAVLFAGGSVRGTYDKMHPLLFGEYLPLGGVFPVLYRWIPNAGHITSGVSDAPLLLGSHRITPLICYEDALPGPTNQAVVHADPDLLVNMTNDSWFGDSSVAAMHFALAKFRAVEHRRYLVRASNSGVSGFVDPVGRASGLTPILEAASRVETVRWMRAGTLYERVGDIPWWIAAAVVVAMGFVARAPGKRKPVSTRTPTDG